MCWSGQCFFSSVIGGRSGNRGMCAQPCRLNYGWNGKADEYPLSLKDLSLAGHLRELAEMGGGLPEAGGPDEAAGVLWLSSPGFIPGR